MRRRVPRIKDAGLVPNEWGGTTELKTVHDLNDCCLDVLSGLARRRSLPASGFVARFRALLRRLDGLARRRAARGPVLLLDLRLHHVEWWQGAITVTRFAPTRAPTAAYFLPPRLARPLARQVLNAAWHAARDHERAGALLFGMRVAVARLLRPLPIHEVERLAHRHAHELRVRFEHVPLYWQRLLVAADAEDPRALADAHRFGVQLLGRELLAPPPRSQK